MKALDTGNDKVRKICEALKHEALEPARVEAEAIVVKAKHDAHHIVELAQKEAQRLVQDAKAQIESERNVFEASLKLAAKQAVSSLKRMIEDQVLNKNFKAIVAKSFADNQLIAHVIRALADAVASSGINSSLTIQLPKIVSKEDIISLLTKEFVSKNKIVVGHHTSGVLVSIDSAQMTLDFSDEAIVSLLANYIRDDFRSYL